jgi:hypothetical protein
MQAIVASLPPKRVHIQAEPVQPLKVVRTGHGDYEEAEALSPASLALRELKDFIATADDKVSVLEWRESSLSAKSLPAGNWVFFATTALEAGPHRVKGSELDFEVEIVPNPPESGRRFSRTFRDARVSVLRSVAPRRAASTAKLP